MNKVKMFLGLACVTVAIASAAFTKANARFTAPEYYITTASIPTCEILPFTSNCTGTQSDCLVTVDEQTDRQVFDTRDAAGAAGCKDPLKKNP